LSLVFSIYLFYLDWQIQQKFSGNRWTLPARVYARPIELFSGKQMTPQMLRQILTGIGFADADIDIGAGRFEQNGKHIEIHTRQFSFWDGDARPQKISVRFADNRISGISDLQSGKKHAYFRLEPQLIGKIYPLHNQDRVLVPYERVPVTLVDALVAVEDRSFFYHTGVDPKGILRAFVANFQTGGFVQGGSTLTQQLVKNFFLSPERTITRKINEIFMALILEYRYSKAEIMSAYINEVYLGQDGARGVHGFGTAAEFYFGKPLDELTTAQLALLVGLVKGASYYNPIRHQQRALSRRNLVLEKMHELGFINRSEMENARAEKLELKQAGHLKSSMSSDFLELVRIQLLETYKNEDLHNEGLRIFTTMDPELQVSLQKSIQNRLRQLEKTGNSNTRNLQAAAIISTVDTGEILALSGSRTPEQGAYNRAIHSSRPIGSLIKPFVYLQALSRPDKYHPLTEIKDAPLEIPSVNGEIWKPRNYSGKYHGTVTLLEALARSYNLASINLGLEVGLKNVIQQLRTLGLNKNINQYPSILLGSIELTPLEVTQLYQVLASGGFRSHLSVIREVLTKHGKPLQKSDIRVNRVVKPEFAIMLNSMLRTVVNSGTAQGLKPVFREKLLLAGKTGTTNNLRDSWFAGFGSNYLGVVWVGKDDNGSTGLTGASGAMRVWGDIMQHVALEPVASTPLPGIKWITVKSFEGDCSDGNEIAFLQHQQPDQRRLCH